jgi:hypothetical protein
MSSRREERAGKPEVTASKRRKPLTPPAAHMPNHPCRKSYQDMHPRPEPDGASNLVSGASASAPAEALETNWLRRKERGHF